MTDDAFSALERRLAHVEALPSSAGAGRDDVLALLAECRSLRAELERLREPPDAAGLMPAAELGELREWEALDHEESHRVWIHIDAQAALIRELYGVVADLHADDPGRQALLGRGRAEGRGEAAGELGRLAEGEDGLAAAATNGGQHFDAVAHSDRARGLTRGEEAVRALGPCRAPLPPCESEARAADRDRLRAALVHVVAALDDYEAVGHGQYPGPVFDAIHAARAALTEDAR